MLSTSSSVNPSPPVLLALSLPSMRQRLFWLTSALAAVSNLHFFDDHHHFITHSSCHYSPLTHFIIRSRTYAWRVWYGGGVGGWVGGIMTFVTTTGHIVSVDDHHHFITHSSCHYSPLTHFIIRSRRRNCIGFRNIKVVIIVFIIIIIRNISRALYGKLLAQLPLFCDFVITFRWDPQKRSRSWLQFFTLGCIHCWAGMLCKSRLKGSRQSRRANSKCYIDGSVVGIYT